MAHVLLKGDTMLRRSLRLGLPILGLLFVACAADSDALSDGSSAPAGASRDPSDSPNGGATSGDDDDAPPPEKEEEESFLTPVATGNLVWIANPVSGRVALVNAKTLEVRTVEAGNGPTFLAAVPSPVGDSAIVLNTLSQDATLLHAEGANVSTKTFKVARAANTWSVSSDGRWAIAWTDARTIKNAPKTQGYQDLTVVDLTGAVAPVVLAVGYRPVRVGFLAQNQRAYAVTQDGVSIVDLTGAGGPLLKKNVAIDAPPVDGGAPVADDPLTRDVSVTPNGAYAFIRREGSKELTVLTLDKEPETRSSLTFSGPLTDFDLTEAGDKGVAVVRDTKTVSIVALPGGLTDPAQIQNVVVQETVGSVALPPGGSLGLLYTNATPVERLTVLSLTVAPTSRVVRLYSPVSSVFGSPDAKHAIVLHPKDGVTQAFSLVPTASDLPAKIVEVPAPPSAVAFSADGTRAVVAERDTSRQIYGVDIARLPQLQVDHLALASPPTAVGVVAGANRAYIAQEHPDGRITFVDFETGQARTLTGFELASRVVDGSKP